MIYLILAILSSASVSVVMRLSDKHVKNNMFMFSSNYVVCAILSFTFLWLDNKEQLSTFKLNNTGMAFTIGLGIVSGILYLASFMLLQLNIKKNGMILASTFMKLGVIVPITMSIFFFGESPRVNHFLGFACTVVAIIVMNLDKTSDQSTQKQTSGFLLLIILLFMGGITDSTINIHDKLGEASLKNYFLLFNFVVALLFSIIVGIVKKQHITKSDVLCGCILGIPNYFASRFLMNSLTDIPAMIAYPSYNVATILLITLIGRVAFKEPLGAKKCVGLGIIVVAIVLLNV